MKNIGRRIVVYGSTGSGKSTFAGRPAEKTGLPHIEMDAIYWLPGWVEKPTEQFRADVLAELEKRPDGWVCDGNYSRIRESVLMQADTVIWLHLPFRVTFTRLLKRTIARAADSRLICGANRESLRQSFFSRDSLLLYAWQNRRAAPERVGRALKEIPHRAEVFELRSAREVRDFLDRNRLPELDR